MEKFAESLRFSALGFAILLAVGCSSSSHYEKTTVMPPISCLPSPSKNTKCDVLMPKSCPLPTASRSQLVIPDHPKIDAWVWRFTNDPKQRRNFRIYLERGVKYVKPMQEIFEKQGLSKELVYLALVESGFTCTARSHAKAVGMWQFIGSTGKNYGLHKNQWIDERRDLLKSTKAAADYLNFLFSMYGDWSLALASYNAGENGVRRALDKSGYCTYWELIDNDFLPLETRNYVPKFFAAIKILRAPKIYGFHFDPNDYKVWYETVKVPGGINLYLLEELIGVPESTLSKYNPELYKSIIPPIAYQYNLRVPLGKSKIVQAEMRHIKDKKMLGFVRYQVRRGDTLYGLAKKYSCSPKMLATVNNISTKSKVKKGQVLNIPQQNILALTELRKKQQIVAAHHSLNTRKKSLRYATAKAKSVHYPVRQGDTLWSISQKFNIPVKNLLSCNNLPSDYTIVPGSRVTICFGE